MELAIRLEQNPFHFCRLNMALMEPRQTYKVPDLPLRQSSLLLSLHPALAFESLSLFLPESTQNSLETLKQDVALRHPCRSLARSRSCSGW